MKIIQGQKTLEQIADLLPSIALLYPFPVALGVVDTAKYIAVVPNDKIALKISVGDPVKEGSAVSKAMQERRNIIQMVPKEVFGVPYKAMSIPVYDDEDTVVGAIAVVLSHENEYVLNEIIQQFSAALPRSVMVSRILLPERKSSPQ